MTSIDRRSLLRGIGALTVGQLLLGCGSQNQVDLRVHFLQNSIPAQLVNQFRNGLNRSIGLDLIPEVELAELFSQLQAQKIQPEDARSSTVPSPLNFGQDWFSSETTQQDLFSLGDYWLGKAVQQGLIQPLNPQQWSYWNQLPSRWKALVTRDRQGNLAPTSQGQVWGAPYRWGATVIAYRKDKFKQLGWTPSDWSDLWRPELRRQISLPDQPREVIGLTLKKLGQSYNRQNIRQLPGLEAELRALHQQVKLYSSDAYLQPLVLGDTWAAVGWSTDVLPLVRRNNLIGMIVPKSGTALWADLWVQPALALKDVPQSPMNQWIDFWWQPQVASQLSRLSDAGSPALSSLNPQQQPLGRLFLNQEQLNRSDLLNPLPNPTIDQYRTLWLDIREGGIQGTG